MATAKQSESPLAGWVLATADVPNSGLQEQRLANKDLRAAFAQTLETPGCDSLAFDYTLKPVGQGRFRLRGRIKALIVQSCVVTLEPVPALLDETITVDLIPAEDLPADIEGVVRLDDEPDLEAIVDGTIDLGRIVYEHVASALDPYPRKPAAEFAWRDDAGAAKINPFAALGKLKDRE